MNPLLKEDNSSLYASIAYNHLIPHPSFNGIFAYNLSQGITDPLMIEPNAANLYARLIAQGDLNVLNQNTTKSLNMTYKNPRIVKDNNIKPIIRYSQTNTFVYRILLIDNIKVIEETNICSGYVQWTTYYDKNIINNDTEHLIVETDGINMD